MKQLDPKEGLLEIEEARWLADDSGCLNLYCHDREGRRVWAFIQKRPHYCDRGHIQLNIEGNLGLDVFDSFPRYFFSFEEADEHTRRFLSWRLWQHSDTAHQSLRPQDYARVDDPMKYDPWRE